MIAGMSTEGASGERSTRLGEIRAGRTAHEVRLARLIPMLTREFSATKTPQELRACADAVLDGFDDARVRTHILTLAHRQASDCLRKDRCDLPAEKERA